MVSGTGKRVADARRAGSSVAPYLEARYRVPVAPGPRAEMSLVAPGLLVANGGHAFGIAQDGPAVVVSEVSYAVNGDVVATVVAAPFEGLLTFDAQGPHDVSARVMDAEGVLRDVPTVAVTVLADTDGDGMSDAYEALHGLDESVDDGDADADSEGFSNLDEFLAGTSASDPGARSPPQTARLANLPAHAWVGTGDDVLIGG